MPRDPNGWHRWTRLAGALWALLALFPVQIDGQALPEERAESKAIGALLDSGRYDEAELAARRWFDAQASSPDAAELDRAQSGHLLVTALVLNGKGADPAALALARDLVRAGESPSGGSAFPIGLALRDLGDVLVKAGQYEEALGPYRRALDLCERGLCSTQPELGEYLDRLSDPLIRLAQYDEAVTQLTLSLQIKERLLPSTDVRIARTLEALGWLQQRKADYATARSSLERALSIREVRTPNHPDMMRSLNVMGDQLWFEGKLHEADGVYRRALAIGESTLRPEHPDLAVTLRNIATVAGDLGDLASAQSLQERAAAIAEKSLGDGNPQLAGYLNDLANTFLSQGEYSRARELYERALQIREARLGPQSVEVATIVYNLAFLHARLHDLSEARRLHSRAVAIWQRALGPDHPYVSRSYVGLAGTLAEQGLDREAIPLFERALALRERRLGPDHPDVARVLTDLAASLAHVKQTRRAEQAVGRALDIWARSGSPEGDGVASALLTRGELRAGAGNFAAARADYERAWNIRRELYGPDHPDVTQGESMLARALAALGDGSAVEHALHAEAESRTHLRLTLSALPERQAFAYAAKRATGLDTALSFAEGDHVTETLDAVIRGRALILDEMAQRRRTATADVAPDMVGLWNALTSAREKLANLIVRGTGTMRPGQYVALVDEARREKELAERALAQRSAKFRADVARADIGLQLVRDALPPAAALVSFVRYGRLSSGIPATPSYAAFVLKPGSAMPILVRLGASAAIDQSIAEWRTEISKGAQSGGIPEAIQSYRASGTILRRLIWDPIAVYVRDVDRVFIVPDGLINVVAFDTLPLGQKTYVVEQRAVIHYLSAERDLVPIAEPSRLGSGLLVLGGAAFESTLPRTSSPRPAAVPVTRSGCGTFESMRFDPLPGSAAEAKQIAGLWTRWVEPGGAEGATILTGRDASEPRFKQQAPSRRVLHIATHGFFLGDSCESQATAGTRSVGGLTRRSPRQSADRDENPLLLSGLALAGANRRTHTRADDEDGILTAEEVAGLNLDGVDWAVLSACDTGLGQLAAGEGVVGLRRAFQIAGARTVIMSLWSIDDEAARQWMRVLYQDRLAKRLTTADAVHDATIDVLRARRTQGSSTHPFYWGGFVAAGEWR